MQVENLSELQILAISLYNANVLAERYQVSFLEQVKNGVPIVDKRTEGNYCSYCKRFAKTATAFEETDKVIFVNSGMFDPGEKQIWIINSHYDGCRGWD